MAAHRKGASPRVFDPAAVEALLGDWQTAGELDDLFRQMKKVLMERVLAGELTHHLGYGHGSGSTSPRRLRIPSRCGGSCRRRMRSRACTCNSARSSRRAATSRRTTPR